MAKRTAEMIDTATGALLSGPMGKGGTNISKFFDKAEDKGADDPFGMGAIQKTLREDMSRMQAKVSEARERMRADMERRRAERENPTDRDRAALAGDPFAEGGDLDQHLARVAAEEAARGRREVATRGPRNRIKRDAAQLGFGQGAGKEKEDDLFQSRFEGLEDLNRRISAAAASEQSPARKVEKAVIEAGAKTAEKLDRIEKLLEDDKQMMTEQNKIIKERSSVAVLA